MSQPMSKDAEVTGDLEASEQTPLEPATIVSSLNDSSDEEITEPASQNTNQSSSKSKKKKSKKARIKKALGVGDHDEESAAASNPASKLTPEMMEQLLEMNPSLKGEVAGMTKDKAADVLKKLDVADLLTGMVCSLFLYSLSQLMEIIRVRKWEESKRYGFI